MASETPPSESSLVARMRRGDEAAFSKLVDRHHRSMLRLARMFVANESAAEEVVQQTWLAVIDGVDDFEGRSSIKTWIFSILTNQAKGRAGADQRTRAWTSVFGEDVDPGEAIDSERFNGAGHWQSPPIRWKINPERRVLKHRLLKVVGRAIDDLPVSQQSVVWLRDVEGLSSAEVCRVLAVSPGNQRVLLHRGRTKVRQAVEAYQERQ